MMPTSTPRAPASWQVGLALTLVYLCWSTTYFAIQEGVRTLPPLLFGGTRIALAGVVLLGYLWAVGQVPAPTRRALLGAWAAGTMLFLGGNGLINMGQKTVPSGVASVLVATCPLFLALLEMLLPRGERLPMLSWIGLLAGLIGVGVLAFGRDPQGGGTTFGVLCCLGSSFTWSVGAVVARHWPTRLTLLQTAALQMLLGGVTMALTGLAVGEGNQVSAESITPRAVFAFFWLLVVGSLIGFVAFVWLLGHTSAAVAGTYAYVNPALAILIGWALAGESVNGSIVLGLAIILSGVALVRSGPQPVKTPVPESDPALILAGPDSVEVAAAEAARVTARV